MSAESLERAAVFYIEHGLRVFPCKPRSKEPLCAHGFQDATTDPERIRQWWGQTPLANVGLPTGTVTGLLVIDADPRNGGPSDRDELVARIGPWPDTAEQITGGGGRHVIFKHPGIPTPKAIEDGIDVKADGGYILVAPSIHPSGKPYEWDGLAGAKALFQPAPVPESLLQRLQAVRNTSRNSSQTADEKWPKGQRNNRLMSAAGTMRRKGLSAAAILAALLEENRRRCEPPLRDNEVRRIAESAARYEPPKEHAAKHSIIIPDVCNAEDLLGMELAAPAPIVDRILYPGVTIMAGRPKVGKSWFALASAISITSGTPLAGHFHVKKPGRVLYLALEENKARTKSRILQLCPSIPDAIRDLRFVYSLKPLQNGGFPQLDELLNAFPSEVVIVDTLLAATSAGGRSKDIVRGDYAEISLFSELTKRHSCAFLLVHHSRKDSAEHDEVDAVIGTSGTSAAVDAIWTLRRGKADGSLILSTVGRELERERYELLFDLDKGGLLFTAAGEDVNRSEQQKDILDLLRDEKKPMSPAAIATALRKNRNTIRRLLQKLYADDLIRKSLKDEYFIAPFGEKWSAA